MNVEAYEPLVRRLCGGLDDAYIRSLAEQEGRIALWRAGATVDDAAEPAAMANTVIRKARQRALLHQFWTGEGPGSKSQCGHGDVDRRTDGRCAICKRDRDRLFARQKRKETASNR